MDIKAITRRFGVRQIAEKCDISEQAVYKWEKAGIISAEYVIAICELANWQTTPHELRPDIYPNPTDGMPRNSCSCIDVREAA